MLGLIITGLVEKLFGKNLRRYFGEKMCTEKYMKENDLYQHELVEIMKEYGLINDDEFDVVESYLFNTNKIACAK